MKIKDRLPKGKGPRLAGGMLLIACGILSVFFLVKTLGGHLGGLVSWGGEKMGMEKMRTAQARKYQCPMHPQIVQDRPGTCPICAMDLQPVAEDEEEAEGKEKKILFYRHPMNPSITSPVPAKDEMGMDFTPVYEEEGEETAVPGRAAVKLPLYKQQLIGVTLGSAERRKLIKTIYTTGRIAYDPGLYQAEEEYLAVLRNLELAQRKPASHAREQAESLLEAARTRLRLLGLSEEQIDALARRGASDPSLLLTPQSGRVWMYADLYESEVFFVRPGGTVRASLPSEPGLIFSGKVTAVDPILDIKTRTARLRAELESSEGRLRPGMYVNAAIEIDLGERLVIPQEAVLSTGRRNLVFVAEGEGRFVPREVGLGLRGEGAVEILEGLQEGERVARSGNFLIDAESQLRGTAGGGAAFYGGKEAAS